jgi:hypothetical protein
MCQQEDEHMLTLAGPSTGRRPGSQQELVLREIDSVVTSKSLSTGRWRERFPTPPSPPALPLKLVFVTERIHDQS